jgi:NADPH:quinone reductase-like Zn-dependent oxidoreductase
MRVGVLAVSYDKRDLAAVIELLESGQVAATIDRRYSLESVPEAFRYLGAGRSKGKVVVTMGV